MIATPAIMKSRRLRRILKMVFIILCTSIAQFSEWLLNRSRNMTLYKDSNYDCKERVIIHLIFRFLFFVCLNVR